MRRMTFKEFLKLLPREGWIVNRSGHIVRRISGSCGPAYVCPWVYVSQLPGVKTSASCQQMLWQGSHDTRAPLFRAADNDPGHNPAIRRRLLEACGLKEPA